MKWFLITCLFLSGLTASVRGDEREERARASVDRAVSNGVAYLLTEQLQTGSFTRSNPNAMTGLACLAILAVGHQPTDATPAGQALSKALTYILDPKLQDATGYFGASDGSRMYGHGIVTLMLSEVVGMGVDAQQDALIRERCQKAVDLIVRAQKAPNKTISAKGGWRYAFNSTDSDLSVTVWQVMALRAAKNAGLTVPKETIDDAVDFIKRCYTSARDKDGKVANLKTACGYVPGNGPSYSTATEGLLALQVCGEYEAQELKGTVAWLQTLNLTPKMGGFFYYGTYYYAQGMYQRGGAEAKGARETVEAMLLAEQKPDGTWLPGGSENFSKLYSTALALMSLSVRYHFMPIYQR